MKYLICSDIHGSFTAAQKIISFFQSEKCDKLVILGDTLYHGPRNPLPEGHNPKAVAELLNSYSDKIIACRGNCDAEVDQKVLKFKTMSDFLKIIDNGVLLFGSHGHVFAPTNPDGTMPVNCEDASFPPLFLTEFPQPAVFFYGHTHIQVLEKRMEKGQELVVCNPGSTSLPKGESPSGFAICEILGSTKISLFDMNGKELKSIEA